MTYTYIRHKQNCQPESEKPEEQHDNIQQAHSLCFFDLLGLET
jgi:hypothetical protein